MRFGDETDRGLKELGQPLTETNERQYRENLRKELGMAAYAIKIEPRIRAAFHPGVECIVLDGLYSWEEYLYLMPQFPQLKLVCIFARPEVRYARLARRKIRPLSPDKARRRDIAEIEKLHKAGPIALADFFIDNNGSLDQLHIRLERLF